MLFGVCWAFSARTDNDYCTGRDVYARFLGPSWQNSGSDPSLVSDFFLLLNNWSMFSSHLALNKMCEVETSTGKILHGNKKGNYIVVIVYIVYIYIIYIVYVVVGSISIPLSIKILPVKGYRNAAAMVWFIPLFSIEHISPVLILSNDMSP